MTGKSQEEADFIIDKVLQQVGLAGDKKTMPSALSGGMRKRAGHACADDQTKILLADEPSSGLDHITSSEIDDLLLMQKQEHKTALIVVTHDVRGARRVGDRIVVLDKGRLIADGSFGQIEHSENQVARDLVRE